MSFSVSDKQYVSFSCSYTMSSMRLPFVLGVYSGVVEHRRVLRRILGESFDGAYASQEMLLSSDTVDIYIPGFFPLISCVSRKPDIPDFLFFLFVEQGV